MNELNTKLNTKNDVLFGKDGWLFLHQGRHKQFSFLLKQEIIDHENISIFEKNIAFRKKFCAESNILYKHTVFPSKPLLKSKFLPEQVKSVQSLYNSYFSNHEDIYYPLEQLSSEVEIFESTFRKFDTHMTDIASLFIARKLVDFVSPGLSNQLEFNKVTQSLLGDLSKMLDRNDKSEEILLQASDESTVYQFNNFNALKGNSGKIEITHCLNPKSEYRLLIFGDSFFRGLVKFFSPFFRDVLFVRTPVFHSEVVKMYSPNVVFTGNAERYLQSVQSDESAQPFLLSNIFMKDYNPQKIFLNAFSAQLSYRYYPKKYKNWHLALNKK